MVCHLSIRLSRLWYLSFILTSESFMEFAIHLNVLVAYGMSRVINFKNV